MSMEIPRKRDEGIASVGEQKKNAELVFIPSPGIGHLVSTIEMAKLLVNRNDQLSITFLVMKLPFDASFTDRTKSLIHRTSISDRIRFHELPLDPAALDSSSQDIVNNFMETYKPYVRDALSNLIKLRTSPPIIGLFVDMFSTTMIDLANEFGLPTYVVFTSGAGFLCFMSHLQILHDQLNLNLVDFKNQDFEITIPSFTNPISAAVFPSALLNQGTALGFLNFAKRYREAKGIIVNTFKELESRAVTHLSNTVHLPNVYHVGPVLNLDRDRNGTDHEEMLIIRWLDDQPPSSVVFLCFGSMGSFGEDQVREIAGALERCGHHFLWSLRRPPQKGVIGFPCDYDHPATVLPKGFLDRTSEIGMVIGWAPQATVLAHKAIGGFVSHCGWNSVLESLWYGVPMATWPIDGEQQLNAFEMVIELGLAVEVKLDYRKEVSLGGDEIVVSSEEIEGSIRYLMKQGSVVRKRVKEMSEKSRRALTLDNGSSSSTSSLDSLIQDLIGNLL